MYKTPPSTRTGWVTGPVYVFEKHQGIKSATVYGRIVERAKIMTYTERDATTQVVRYGGMLWRLYPPEIFPELSKRWVKREDRIYGEGMVPPTLPLTIPFICDADKPLGRY